MFVALLTWLFVIGEGWSALLADGDTGWHIRTGEWILANGFPRADPYSFTKAGEPWHAWEWLSEVAMAGLHRRLGLKGVVLAAGVTIAAALAATFRNALRRGSNVWIAVAATLLAAGASSVHFLARPHVITLLLLPVSLRLAETRAAWSLVPAAALWANLHAGFVALPLSLGVIAAGRLLERNRGEARRCALLAGGCLLATLANPYGIALHRHILAYVRSGWIREAVEEFQAPRFRSESGLQFEILLFGALLAAASLLARRRFAGALLAGCWAHAALVSARHIPLFAVVAAPVIAGEASELWRRTRALPVLRAAGEEARGGALRMGVLGPACVLLLLCLGAPLRWPRSFPPVRFPVALIERQAGVLAGARVFTSDEWGDYLLYRFYPRQRVFIDGRSDFYGPAIGRLYLRTAYAHAGWPATLERHGIRLVLAPRDWPLAWALEREPGWVRVDEDGLAVLYRCIHRRGAENAEVAQSNTGTFLFSARSPCSLRLRGD